MTGSATAAAAGEGTLVCTTTAASASASPRAAEASDPPAASMEAPVNSMGAPATSLGAAAGHRGAADEARVHLLYGLPEKELFEDIVLRYLLHVQDVPAGPGKPLVQLACTNWATRKTLLKWQTGPAAGEARIGSADILLAAGDRRGRGAQEQLTRGFPRQATLRRLLVQFQLDASAGCLVSFLSHPGLMGRMVTVLELEIRRVEGGPGRRPLNDGAFLAVGRACPSLVRLTLKVPGQQLSCLMPLYRLGSLRELVLDCLLTNISLDDLKALRSLTSLTKLSVFTDELAKLAQPPFGNLLTGVRLKSLSGFADPQLALLPGLQQLTHFEWVISDQVVRPLSPSALLDICSCTQLVSLSLLSHSVADPQPLLNMPCLKSLAVYNSRLL